MPTIDSGNSPGQRLAAGDDVLRAAKLTHTKPVAGKLAAFRAAHKAYGAADGKVKAALAVVAKQQRLLGKRDGEQDELIDPLASRLAGDGFPRTNPFKAFGAPAPSALKDVEATVEATAGADVVLTLCAKIAQHASTSKGTRATAKKLAAAAKGVIAAEKPLEKLGAKVTQAMADRDALARPWEKSFRVLQRSARAAEDDGAPDLYEALFVRHAPKAPANKKPAKGAQPANGAAMP